VSHPQLARMQAEWRQNRRLRLGALAILAIVGLQLVLFLSEARVKRIEQYQRDARLLVRLQEASGEAAWPARAKAADAALSKLHDSIPAASTEGLAQAELQAWLGDLAAFAGIGNPVVRVETALAVDGHPDLWQVLARLEGNMAEAQVPLLMRTLSAALPWYRTERLQVEVGASPRMSLVLRGYFRKSDGKRVGAVRPAGLPSAAETALAGAPAPPPRRNPLAPADQVAGAPAEVSPGAAARAAARGGAATQGASTRPRNPLAPPGATSQSKAQKHRRHEDSPNRIRRKATSGSEPRPAGGAR
jgi:hypothetical protein